MVDDSDDMMDGVSRAEGTERVGDGDSEGTVFSCRGLRRPGKQMMARYQWALKHGRQQYKMGFYC